MSAQIMKGRHMIFVFIDTTPAKERKVLEELLKVDEVREGHVISGQYDLLVVLQLDLYGQAIFTSVQEAAQKIIDKIRRLKDVRDTNTIVPFFSVAK
jgi:DNA-binding Lrp family transcriptional regulator